MSAKKKLQEYTKKRNKLKKLNEDYMELKVTMVTAKAQKYSDMPSAGKKSCLADTIIKLEEMEERYNQFTRETSEVTKAIYELKGDMQLVMRLKYIHQNNDVVIAKKLSLSKDRVKELHEEALKIIKL